MRTESKYRFVHIGTMTYDVFERATGTLIGQVWRERGDVWRGKSARGAVVEFAGSRNMAAGVLRIANAEASR